MNNNNNNPANNSFVDSFKSVSKNLAIRYSINMHIDFINEFIKFADNTRDIELQSLILAEIQHAEENILNFIKTFENERDNKENID